MDVKGIFAELSQNLEETKHLLTQFLNFRAEYLSRHTELSFDCLVHGFDHTEIKKLVDNLDYQDMREDIESITSYKEMVICSIRLCGLSNQKKLDKFAVKMASQRSSSCDDKVWRDFNQIKSKQEQEAANLPSCCTIKDQVLSNSRIHFQMRKQQERNRPCRKDKAA